MTTQPLDPNLMEITEMPILGITGALGSSVGPPTNLPLPTYFNTGPIYWKTINITVDQAPGTRLIAAEDVIGPSTLFKLPVPFSLQHSTHAEFSIVKAYVIFEPIKLSGSEVRVTVKTMSAPSGHTKLFPTLGQYSITQELVFNEGGKLQMVEIPIWESNFRIRNMPSVGASSLPSPMPISKIDVRTKTRYQITPMHPAQFNVNMYFLPFINYALPSLTTDMALTLFSYNTEKSTLTNLQSQFTLTVPL